MAEPVFIEGSPQYEYDLNAGEYGFFECGGCCSERGRVETSS